MRTTLIIPDPVGIRAKAFAKAHNRTLSDVVTEAIVARLALAEDDVREAPGRYRVGTVPMGQPKVDVNDRDALYRRMEEEA